MLKLSEDLLLGIPKIDGQHQELLKMLNTAQNVGVKFYSPEETIKMLDFLANYVIEHFNDEEAYQRESGYPKFDLHKEQHVSFVNNYINLKQQYLDNGASAKLSVDILRFTISWVIRHIKDSDVEFGRYYRQQAEFGSRQSRGDGSAQSG